jgi:hypothetical protein
MENIDKLHEMLNKALNAEKVERVRCAKCGKTHVVEPSSKPRYVTVYGNITMEADGGVVGNHFDQDGRLAGASVYCHPHCIAAVLEIPVAPEINQRKGV